MKLWGKHRKLLEEGYSMSSDISISHNHDDKQHSSIILKKRIGVIAGKLYKEVNQEYLHGVLEQARALGFQVFVFTLAEENHNEKIIQGEENLFRLINFSMLDGIIYIPYTFSSPTYWEFIEKFLEESCSVPIVRIGTEQEKFIPLWHNERAEMRELTEHLIKEHSCRKIHCLTGLDYMEVSHNRLDGYKDAMDAAGLAYSDDDITFGDFWIFKSKELAQEIADGKREKPDAVVCANDVMAIALCDALIEKGYSVPDDVKIVGYDGSMETRIHIPPISTYQPSWVQLGREAVCLLYSTLTGNRISPCGYSKGMLWKRKSCGCNPNPDTMAGIIFDYQRMEENYMDARLSTDLHLAVNLDDFLEKLYAHTEVYMTEEEWKKNQFYLCLCEDWNVTQLKDYTTEFRTAGYSAQMTLIAHEGGRSHFSLSEMFPCSEDENAVLYFTPVHFQERCFGYAVLKKSDGIAGFNAHYLRYLRELNNGLGFLCMRNEAQSLAYRNFMSGMRDELTGLYKIEMAEKLWNEMVQKAARQDEWIYMIGVSLNGFHQVEESFGPIVRDKLLSDFSDMLLGCCTKGEKCMLLENYGFLVVGTENHPYTDHIDFQKNLSERYCTLLQNASPMECVELVVMETIVSADTELQIAMEKFRNYFAMHINKTFPNSEHYKALLALRTEMYRHPEMEWSLETCTKKINLSSAHFQRLYRASFGKSWLQEVKCSKLQYAKKLLITTNEKLEKIAVMCGYDYAHFMRTFKKNIGITPKEYRRIKKSQNNL